LEDSTDPNLLQEALEAFTDTCLTACDQGTLLQQQLSDCQASLSHTKDELTSAKSRLQILEDDCLQKTAVISEMEKVNTQLENDLSELKELQRA
jgi:chromosome segregation ATPase